MMYLYVPIGDGAGQSNKAPTEEDIDSVLDGELEIFRFDLAVGVFEQLNFKEEWVLAEKFIIDSEHNYHRGK